MSDKSLTTILEAESHTEETRSFIKQVRCITRRKYTPEKKIRIVLEGFRHGGTDKGFISQRRHQAERILCLATGFYGGW